MAVIERTLRAVWARVLRRGGLDPRVLQVGFSALMVVTLLSAVPFGGWGSVTPSIVVTVVVVVAAAVFVLVATPLVESTEWLILVMPYVAYASIGISVMETDVGTLPLVVLPSVTLARQLGWRAVPMSGLATVVLVTVPAVVVHGNGDDTVRQVIPLPVVAMVSAAAVAVWLEAARAARSQAQEALAELERQRRTRDAFVATVDVGLLLVDPQGNRLVSNNRMRELVDLKFPVGREHSVGQVYAADGRTPLGVEDLPSSRGVRGEEFDDLRVWVGEVPAARRALSVNARNVHDESGRRTGTALVYQDITELARASAVKDEFIGLVSHELRTPLTSIYGYVCLLRDRDDLPPQAAKHLEVVARSTDRLRLLVNDLLDATKVIGGGLRLDLERCDLAETVRDAVQSAGPQAEEAGIALGTKICGPVPATVDRARISQVLDNLISNAIKYTPAGGWARVELDRVDGDLVIRVQDSGIGIREEDISRVFGRFYRTSEASQRAIQGAGLGLAIVRSIVEGHGGRIEVSSRPGDGTEFRVVLPAGCAGPGLGSRP